MSLAEYVQRIMDEKGLKAGQVAKRSKGGIGDSHVTNIINGTTTNLTLERIKALALGLGVDPTEVFRAAIGVETELTIATISRLLDKLLTDPNLPHLFVLLDSMNQTQTKSLRLAAKRLVDNSNK
jgi:transcriptional regulator with XRE-family HTH domain